MLYNINNNNYISVLDIQLSLNLLQGSLYLSKLLITKLYVMYVNRGGSRDSVDGGGAQLWGNIFNN